MTRTYRVLLAMAFVVFLLAAANTAQAHSPDELEAWRTDWTERVDTAGAVTPELVDEWREMADRHGCDWPGTECAVIVRPVSRSVALVPAVNPVSGNVEQWRGLVAAYGGWDVDRMLRIMACESGGSPTAKNPRSSATGLFQIMASIWHDGRDLYDPGVNVDVAHHVWTQQGYAAWVCRG